MTYPEDPNKANWDLIITLILVLSCIMTPVNMAFDKELGNEWDWILGFMDFLFLIDCIVIFNSAIDDEDFRIVEDRKLIACIYLKGWFLIDIMAIIPFDFIIMAVVNDPTGSNSSANLNKMIRVVRIGRIYKLIKLTKLLRIMKVMKEKSKLG